MSLFPAYIMVIVFPLRVQVCSDTTFGNDELIDPVSLCLRNIGTIPTSNVAMDF